MNTDASDVLVVNPRRRRRRKMTALQQLYFGGGRRRTHRRNDPGPARRHRRRSARRVRVGHYLRLNPGYHRRRRNDPGVGAVGGHITHLVREAVTATVGVQANNLVGNALASKLLKVSGKKRALVKIGTPVVTTVLAAMFSPRWVKAVAAAGGAAIALEVTKLLNAHVYPQLGTVGNLLSSADVDVPAGYQAPGTPEVRPFGSLGYNSIIRYPAGAVIPPDIGVGAYVRRTPYNRALGYGEPSEQMSGMYGGGASVY